MTIIDYYFTPQSPWTYLGHARLLGMAEKYKAQIRCKPCDMGKVFSVSGGLPLSKRPAQRQAYRLVELARWRDHLGLALNVHPKFFPVAGDDASRLIIAARQRYGESQAMALTGLVLKAVWADELNIADREQLASLAAHCGAGELKALDCDDGAAQAEYELNTQTSIDLQIFGAPWYLIDGESFWGQDRLDFVEAKLAKLNPGV
jgi:2-hydroxychromene-2-carboxylate isomerase